MTTSIDHLSYTAIISGSTVCSQHKSSGAAKHIDIEYYDVKDKVRDQVISPEHISTEKMLADPLSKGLPPNVFREHGV